MGAKVEANGSERAGQVSPSQGRTPRRRLMMGVAIVALGAFGFTAPADAETLKEALALAYLGNPTLEAQRANLRATDETVPQARAGLRPNASIQGTGGRTTSNSKVTGFQGNNIAGLGSSRTKSAYNPVTGTFALEQPIYTGGVVSNSIDQAEYGVQAARYQLTSVEQQVLLDGVQAFLDVLANQAVVDLNKNNVEVLTQQLQATKDRFEVGELTRTDVAQAEARLSRGNSELTAAEAQLTASEAAYENVIGQPPINLVRPESLPPFPPTEEEALAVGLKNNPALNASRSAEKASREAIDVAKGALLPNLGVQGQYQIANDPAASVDNSRGFSVLGVLNIPIYQGGGEYASVRGAQQLNSQSRLDIAAAQRDVTQNVATAWDQLKAATAQITSDEEQVRANRIAADGVRQEALVGTRTTLDVLNADQELLNSQVALVASRRNEYVAAYSLLASIGLLTARALELDVPYYDPTAYYNKVEDKWFGFDSEAETQDYP